MVVYNTRGRVVRRLPPRQFDAGDHALSWRGQDERGRPVSTGVYIYRLRVAAGAWTFGRLTLVK
jgi:flagellar hook assembly protein FlgD